MMQGDINTVYNSEQSAASIYSRLIKDIEDQDIKQNMVYAKQTHLKHLQDIEVYMDFAGVHPINTSAITHAFEDIMLLIENKKKDDGEMLSIAAQKEREIADEYRSIYNELKDRKVKELIENVIKSNLRIAQKLDSSKKC